MHWVIHVEARKQSEIPGICEGCDKVLRALQLGTLMA